MPTSKRLRNVGRGHPVPTVTGVLRRQRGDLGGNMGTQDVRGRLGTRVITLGSYGGTDEFKIRVEFTSARANELVAGKEATVETDAFVRGTNGTAAAIQAALRTATGDAGLTVSGTTDEGPFTVTEGDTSSAHRAQWELSLVDLVGCSGHVTSAAAGSGSYRGEGLEVPLGYSIVTNGVGQTAQATLVPPVIDSAVGGDDQVVISGTEDASGGTGAVVGYAIFKTLTDEPHSVVYSEDADGDVTVTGLADATDYYVVGFTQTAPDDTALGDEALKAERVSRGTPPEFFTTT